MVFHALIESNLSIGVLPQTTGLDSAPQVSSVIKELQCQVFTLLRAPYTLLAQTPADPSQGRSRAFGDRPHILVWRCVCVCVAGWLAGCTHTFVFFFMSLLRHWHCKAQTTISIYDKEWPSFFEIDPALKCWVSNPRNSTSASTSSWLQLLAAITPPPQLYFVKGTCLNFKTKHMLFNFATNRFFLSCCF